MIDKYFLSQCDLKGSIVKAEEQYGADTYMLSTSCSDMRVNT